MPSDNSSIQKDTPLDKHLLSKRFFLLFTQYPEQGFIKKSITNVELKDKCVTITFEQELSNDGIKTVKSWLKELTKLNLVKVVSHDLEDLSNINLSVRFIFAKKRDAEASANWWCSGLEKQISGPAIENKPFSKCILL